MSISAMRVHFLGVVLPLWTLGCGLYGGLLAERGFREGLPLLGLWLVATLVWLGALLRIAAVARAPAWTAPLHVIGAWLTGKLLYEAADDLRARVPTQWGGREYDLGAGLPAPVRPGAEADPKRSQAESSGVRNPG